jgi:hypothetical protein
MENKAVTRIAATSYSRRISAIELRLKQITVRELRNYGNTQSITRCNMLLLVRG